MAAKRLKAQDVERAHSFIMSKIKTNLSYNEIISLTMAEFERTDHAAKKLYTDAVKKIKETYDTDIEEVRVLMLEKKLGDMREAYSNYEKAKKESKNKTGGSNWFVIYLNIKEQIEAFYPELKENRSGDQDVKLIIKGLS